MKRDHPVLPRRESPPFTADVCVRADHPLRSIKQRTDAAVREIDPVLKVLRARREPQGVNPAWVFGGHVLITLYGIASDRAFCAELGANQLFRWFLDMQPWHTAPDWWEFARERRSLSDSIVGRCLFRVVFAPVSVDGSLDATEHAVDDRLIRSLESHECQAEPAHDQR
jgi:hypothetical protein